MPAPPTTPDPRIVAKGYAASPVELTPTQAELLGYLADGERVTIRRRNSGAAREANELAVKGLVTMRVVQEDSQSSYLLLELAP